jgi:hypothetical protein
LYANLDGILEEETNNDVGKPEVREDLRVAIDELKVAQDLIGKQIPAINVLGQVSDSNKYREQAQVIMDAQQDIIAKLEEIKKRIKAIDDRTWFALQIEVMINNVREVQSIIDNVKNKGIENDIPKDK